MKPLTLLSFIFLSLAAFGQEPSKPTVTKEFHRVQVGISFSPDYCYRILTKNSTSQYTSQHIDLRNNNEAPKFGYTTGLTFGFNISNRFGIFSGIQYSNKGFATKNTTLIYGYPTIGNPSKAQFIYNHFYLEIPLIAKLCFGKKKIRFIAGMGITAGIFIKATQTMVLDYGNGKTERQTNPQTFKYNTIDLSPTLSLGIDYKISNKFNLRVEPTIKKGFFKIIDAPIATYLWNAGLNIGCYYGFK